MIFSALIAVISIAFPPEGAKLPAVSRCYAIGATDGGEVEITVNHKSVPVYRTGAWSSVIEVVPGTNVLEVGGVKRTFVVGSLGSKGLDEKKVYKKLEYAADVAKAHPTGKKPAEITIVLDAGHGGNDGGAISPHGLPEKDANLRLAKAVRSELVKRGFRVVMTREEDIFIPLNDRPKVAHKENADAFVSIHHNAPGYEQNPLECRYHAVYAWNEIGERLAEAVNLRMSAALLPRTSKGVLHANFLVTRNPEIPSCLVEADFITHPDGEADSWSVPEREKVAAAIANGIADWVAQ